MIPTRSNYASKSFAIFLLALVAGRALAFDVKRSDKPLAELEFFRPELTVDTGNIPVQEFAGSFASRQEGWARLLAAVGPDAPVYLDPRSGVPTGIMTGVPMVPGRGAGNGVTLETLSLSLGHAVGTVDAAVIGDVMRRFVVKNASGLAIDAAQLGAVHAAEVTPEMWHVRIPQVVDGIPVRYAHLSATLVQGNMVLLGSEMWGNVAIDTHPALAAAQAEESGWTYVGGRTAEDVVTSQPALEIIPFTRSTPGGNVYGHYLAWVYVFQRGDEIETWEVMVDARDGTLIAFQDINHYATEKISGGAYPLTNTGICPSNATCGTMQSGEPMPYANTGLAAPNNYTNAAGLFTYTSGTVTTTLDGRYVRMTDTCGPISVSASGSINLGGTNNQHDCQTGTGAGGNTASSRSGFYELNKLIEVARGWLPLNTWLNNKITSNMNIVDVCNAGYSPGNGSINFFRSGGGCRNTGEIAAVFDHEWGHALDDNDSGQNLSSSSEAYADIASIYRLRASCVGYGFLQSGSTGCGNTADGTGPNQNESQVGSYCDTNCSGVRDADWGGHVSQAPATALGFVCTHCLTGSGPCGRQVHCAAAPSRQAAWDFVARDLQAPPFSMTREDAFNLGSRIFFQGSGGIQTWHSCTCGSASSGCGATNAYSLWLAADDDDGVLTNGTPHMTALYNAFNRHGIACASPTPQNSGCASGPSTPPAMTVTNTAANQNTVTWTAVPGASKYRVLRTEGFAGCDFGKAVIFDGVGSSYVDNAVADGRTYYYVVQAVGASDRCGSPASSCESVTPVSCNGALSTDRPSYNCSDNVQLRLSDADLIGAGTVSVAVRSSVESVPELVVLTELPAGSGLFRGSIPTNALTPAADGILSVATGGSVTVDFVDASACGTPDVPITATAPVDCTGQTCAGAITLNKTTFNCSDTVQITLVDTDLRGAGSRSVAVSSSVETTPEVINLVESPANSGTFVGSITTSSAAPGPNGVLNVATGGTLKVEYGDASACGVLNVTAQKTAPVNCAGQPCTGALSTNKTTYTCSDTVQVTLVDSDLAGTGSRSISIVSAQETTPEILNLIETPPGSGTFTGSMPTTGAAAAPDGLISGADGSTATLSYLDDSACGILAVTAQKNVGLDCLPPAIFNVHADPVSATSADVKWDTNEASTSAVTFGTTAPPGTPGPGSATLVTAHVVRLSGLAQCTTHYYSVGSTDALAQSALADNAGQFYTFEVGGQGSSTLAATDTPVAIPVQSAFPVLSTVQVASGSPPLDINVKINIAHTFDGQLGISLRHPDGSRIFLSNRRGSTGDNFINTVFDDEAATAITAGIAPFTGTFRPEGLLSSFESKSPQGTWALEVVDNVAGDSGAITGFELILTLPEACSAECGEQSSTRLSDACVSGGGGNGNGAWDDGESAAVRVTLENTGEFDLTGVTARLIPTTPGIAMIDDTAAFPDIPRGTNAASAAPDFAAYLPVGLPCGTPITFQVAIQSDQGAFVDTFQLGSSGQGSVPSCSSVSCAQLAPPLEVPGLTWTSKSTVAWSGAVGAASYVLYRGESTALADLESALVDSCERASTASTAAAGLTDDPAPGTFTWWLVRATNAIGLGTAGDATSGPRVHDPAGLCP